MGYSIATPIRNAEAKKEMLEFLKKNFRNTEDVFKVPHYSRGPLGEDLSYDHGKCRIGFDYNCGEPERGYIYTVCRWMALKVGALQRFNLTEGKVELIGEFPYLVYDGYGHTPVIQEDPKRVVPDVYRYYVMDQLGVKADTYSLDSWLKKELGIDPLQALKEEMKRLDAEWTSGRKS